MTQTHSNLQAIRSVSRNSRPSTPDPDEIVYVEVYTDPETKNQFVLWDDIRQVFGDALHVRHQAKALPFLKGADYNPLKPFRIAAVPNVVLDVHVSEPKAAATITPTEATPPRRPVAPPAPAPQQPSGLDHIRQQASHYPKYDPLTALQFNPVPPLPLPPAPQQPTVVRPVHVLNNNRQEASLKRMEETTKEKIAAHDDDLEPSIDRDDILPKDYMAVLECYLKNLHRGYTQALISVGDLFYEGQGVTQDKEVAFGWYLKAASFGDAIAQAKVDVFTYKRDEVGPSTICLDDAFESSSVCTEDTLATHTADDSRINSGYFEEEGDIDIENIASLSIVDQEDNASELSPPPSSSSSSGPYTYPPRPQQPRSTFAAYFESDAISIVISDAKEGNKHAQFALGERHRLGKGVLQDDRVALDWILKAAHQGEGAAQYQAGQMYEEGCGTRKDLALAMGWYQKAAEKCVADARERYARLRGMGYN